MYGKVTYVDVVNRVSAEGWTIVAQTPDATEAEKTVGVPRVPAILLALIPLLGMILVSAWIYMRGSAQVTVERKLTSARIITPNHTYDINKGEDLDMFLDMHNYRGNIGYYPVVITGIVILFMVGIFIQVS
jgi:hypothetical protein